MEVYFARSQYLNSVFQDDEGLLQKQTARNTVNCWEIIAMKRSSPPEWERRQLMLALGREKFCMPMTHRKNSPTNDGTTSLQAIRNWLQEILKPSRNGCLPTAIWLTLLPIKETKLQWQTQPPVRNTNSENTITNFQSVSCMPGSKHQLIKVDLMVSVMLKAKCVSVEIPSENACWNF